MKTLKKVPITPVWLGGYMPEELEEGKLYISEQYGVAIHLCLCGCKEKTVTPLGMHGGVEGWILTKRASDGAVSLSPSISNYQTQCKSHYIITNNVANFV